MDKKIGLVTLTFFIVSGLDTIRNLPAMALFGSSLLFVFLLGAIFFLIPIALVAAEFSTRFPKEGGVFHWVKHAFGEHLAVFAIWLQWINTVVWYPTILSFIAGTFAYLLNPSLAQSKEFIVLIILTVFWGLTFLNFKGANLSAKINAICGALGLFAPIFLLIILGCIWAFNHQPIQIKFDLDTIIHPFSNSHNLVLLIAIMGAFQGMELAGAHVSAVENPKKNFPKAMTFSVLILLSTMMLGALFIAVLIPKENIRLVDGIMQSFQVIFDHFELSWATKVVSFVMVFGCAGSLINWLLAPVKGLCYVAEHGFLPSFWAAKNEKDVPVKLMLIQAVIVSLLCLVFHLMPTINAFYWFLSSLATELYMVMYILLFFSALKLGRETSIMTMQIPKGLRHSSCVLGLVGCLSTIVVGFIPPEEIYVGGKVRYALLIALGNLILVAPVFGLVYYKKISGKR